MPSVLGKQTAKALLDLLGVGLRSPGQWAEQIWLFTQKILKLEAYGKINIRLGAINYLIRRWALGCGRIAAYVACAAKHRRQEACKLAGLVVFIHHVIPG
jgi:hypothetical protein